MVWKTERWLTEVFPGEEKIYSEYQTLSPRELAIVSAAVLDVALAELLTHRLSGENREIEAFLGLNGDGRAPVATFGARIQLGLLVGILVPSDAAILRIIKDIRNQFAHRTNVDFLSPTILKSSRKLLSLWMRRHSELTRAGHMVGKPEQFSIIGEYLPNVSEAGEGLVLSVFSVYQAYFHRMHSRILPIGNAIGREQ